MELSLESITSVPKERPDRIVLYGIEGIGKTTFASKFPKPIFLCTEDGLDKLKDIKAPRFPLLDNWGAFTQALKLLGTNDHDYETAVVDTVDWACNFAKSYLIKEKYGGELDKFNSYGAGFNNLHEEFLKLLKTLDYLNKKKNMRILLLAHCQILTFRNPMGEDYDRYQPKLPDSNKTSLNRLVKEWADMVLFAIKETVIKEGKGNDGGRVLHTTHSASWDAKNRHNMPDKIAFNYDILEPYLNCIKKPKAKKEKSNARPVSDS